MERDASVEEGVARRATRSSTLALGPWKRETLSSPRLFAQAVLSWLAFPVFKLLAPESHASMLAPMLLAMAGSIGVFVAVRIWARPPGEEPVEVDQSGVWIASRDTEGHKTRRHIAFDAMHAVRARRGWIAFLGAGGDTLFVVRGTEHHNASLLADAARTTGGPRVVLPGASPDEAFRLRPMFFGYVATVCWMLAIARAPVPLDWLAALAIVPVFAVGMWRQARRTPSVELALRAAPTYREPAS